MVAALTRLMPAVRLTDAAFASRHRALRVILWLHLPLVVGVALLTGNGGVPGAGGHHHGGGTGSHAWLVWSMIAGVLLCAMATGITRSRRAGALAVAFGLLFGAAALVHAGGGMTDLHFHFFVVLALISMYQDWLVLLPSVLLVASHHLGIGTVAANALYNNPVAQRNPLAYALLHAAFVLAMVAGSIAYWRFAGTAQAEADASRELATADSEAALRRVADDASGREAAAAADANAQLQRSEELATRLEAVLGSVADSGVRLGAEAGEAMESFESALAGVTRRVDVATKDLEAALDGSTTARRVITGLEAAIAEIATVAGLIQSVADQTKLLALNATIEAARAGEAGKGFGVVANEVKELAAETAAATARIESTVAQVTAGASAVAEAVTGVAHRLTVVAETQRQVTASLTEQTGLAARTRVSIAEAAQQVSATATGHRL
jgi:methyl-accepting chemotaxis protein